MLLVIKISPFPHRAHRVRSNIILIQLITIDYHVNFRYVIVYFLCNSTISSYYDINSRSVRHIILFISPSRRCPTSPCPRTSHIVIFKSVWIIMKYDIGTDGNSWIEDGHGWCKPENYSSCASSLLLPYSMLNLRTSYFIFTTFVRNTFFWNL